MLLKGEKMNKILITGGTGFIGKYVCKECQENQIDYLALGADDCNMKSGNRIKMVDLLNYNELSETIRNFLPDAIIHLAAIASPVHNDAAQIYKVNVCGTENVLKAALSMETPPKLLLISTAGVYGNQQVCHLHESLPFNPVNHYSYSKMVTEIMSRQYSDQMDICIIRPFNVIGSGQSRSFFVPKLVAAFSNRETVLHLGNMDAIRDYVSVDFCAKLFVDLCIRNKKNPNIVNICSGIGHSCMDIYNILTKLTGFYPQIIKESSFTRRNEIWSLVGDTQIMNSVINGRYASPDLYTILDTMLNSNKK